LVPKTNNPEDCHRDPTGTWSLPATAPVVALSCVRDGDENDAIEDILHTGPVELATNPGIEWAQEDNNCFVSGQGYRHPAL
jgi:hypothetical protein